MYFLKLKQKIVDYLRKEWDKVIEAFHNELYEMKLEIMETATNILFLCVCVLLDPGCLILLLFVGFMLFVLLVGLLEPLIG